uniref:Reverse transcriptase domain-containing protein n=1 Tax=Erpetoichthys calabaricus TaxID=27687 RepID=A0A8C4SY43_ERPCA
MNNNSEILKGLEFRVMVRGTSSELANVKSSDQQGSVWGPLLFLIYINDLDRNISNKLMKFNVSKCQKIESTPYEKDLGVIVDSKLSTSRQCSEAIKKANRMSGYIAP